jgi:heterodisulfide reductase subunit D
MELKKKNFVNDLSKQQLIELDACVNCGECLNWCVIQDVIGDPLVSPPERIRKYKEFVNSTDGLWSKLFGPKEIGQETLDQFRDILWKCVLCGNCGEVCEVGIDLKKLWWILRKKSSELIGMPKPLEGAVTNYQKFHSPFPQPLTNRYKFWLPDEVKVASRAEICLYEGCGNAWDCPQGAEGAARLLSAGGEFTVLDPEESWCCGWPQVAGSGDWSILPELVKHFVAAVKSKGIKRLALTCPMCRDIFLWLYPRYYGDELPFEVVMVIEIIAEYIEEGRIKFTKRFDETVTVHDPCALARPILGAPILAPLRKIVDALPGVKRVEMKRSQEKTRCCGGSAGQRGLNPDLAVKMAKELLKEGANVGADTMLTSCPACYVILAGRTHIAPTSTTEEYKHFEAPIRVNDLLQYAAQFL